MNNKLHSLAFATLLVIGLPMASTSAQVGFSVNFAPPPLPVVEQPLCPVDGYLWTPGYWAYGDLGYYWVPGFWAPPPAVGLLWTPPWWGFANGIYVFHQGYWGPRVGFYGGINYGYGYFGNGFYGGRWAGNVFRYNTAVVRVNKTVIHNTYVNRTILPQQKNLSRASFNGPGGVRAQETAAQKAAAGAARRVPPTSEQISRQEMASKNRELQASVNNGRPSATAIKSFRQNGQATGGASASEKAGNQNRAPRDKASQSGTASRAEHEPKAETGVQRDNVAREKARQREQSRAAEVQRENARAAQNREAQARKASEQRAQADAARRGMTERSRRPEVAMPRPPTQGGHGQPPPQERKRKSSKPDQGH